MNQEAKMEAMLNLMASSEEVDNTQDQSIDKYAPWSTLHLSKKERKGLTFDQIQSLRRTKWVEYMKEQKQSNGESR